MPARRSTSAPRRIVVALAAACALVAGACSDPGSFRGIALDPPEPAPELRLATAQGDTFDLAAQRGSAVLVFFGYTHCPDVCPTTLADWARVRGALGRDADRVRFVFVSVDPERDSPEKAMSYARQFDPSFVGLTADRTGLPALLARFRVSAHEEPAPEADGDGDEGGGADGGQLAASGTPPGMITGDYMVAHSSQTFLIDPEGRLRVLFPMGSTTTDIVDDVRRVL